MLRTTSLTTSFGKRTLWRDLSLQIDKGTMTALIGPSGSGKSTLLNCIGLLAKPTSGRIEVNGRDITSLKPAAARRFRRDQLGYLFQNYALIEDATLYENLAVVSQAGRGRRGSKRAQMEQALEQVGLSINLSTKVARLSGGEQQRVAVARLLLKKPSLVLADEPTGALDQSNTEAVIGLLRGLADDGACVIIATHDEWVRDACDAQVSIGDSAPTTAADSETAERPDRIATKAGVAP